MTIKNNLIQTTANNLNAKQINTKGCSKEIDDTHIVVLSGGWGKIPQEKKHSLDYANTVATFMKEAGYHVTVIECNKQTDILTLRPKQNMVVYNCLYGKFGEDGILPSILEFLGISYTGCSPLSSFLTMNKACCYQLLRGSNILIPNYILFEYDETRLKESDLLANFKKLMARVKSDSYETTLSYPVIVKPNRAGFSAGITVVDCLTKILEAVKRAAYFDNQVIIQDFIKGTLVCVPVLCGEALIPVEVVQKLIDDPLSNFSFRSSNKTYIIPARFKSKVIQNLRRIAETIYKNLGCRGLTRCDFQLAKGGTIYFLEVNSQHSIRNKSIALQSAMAFGLSGIEVITRISDRNLLFCPF